MNDNKKAFKLIYHAQEAIKKGQIECFISFILQQNNKGMPKRISKYEVMIRFHGNIYYFLIKMERNGTRARAACNKL